MSGTGGADDAPAAPDPPVDAEVGSPGAAATAPAKPTASPARVRPAHVVPGVSGQATGAVPAFVAAVHARDAAAARAALSPSFRGIANGRPMDPDAQVRLLESFWTGFPDATLAMEPTGGSGRYVITWTLAGAHGGVYLGVPPTGAHVAFSGYIVAVADATGVTSLDWKWDTKAFTKAVLGPDQVGDLEVKDTFRDPSKRWQQASPGGQRRRQGKGPRGPKPAPQQGVGQPRAPREPRLGPDGQPLPAEPGQPGAPGQGKRRRRRGRGKGGQPGQPHAGAPGQAQGGAGPASPDSVSSVRSVDSEGPGPSTEPTERTEASPDAPGPQPDGT